MSRTTKSHPVKYTCRKRQVYFSGGPKYKNTKMRAKLSFLIVKINYFSMKYDFHTSRIKGHMCNALIRAVWKSYFNRKDAYHREIFETSIFHDVSKLHISQWEIFFLMEYDFHTSQIKACMFDSFIREVWKSPFNWKDVYHREIFKTFIFMTCQNYIFRNDKHFFWWSMTFILHK